MVPTNGYRFLSGLIAGILLLLLCAGAGGGLYLLGRYQAAAPKQTVYLPTHDTSEEAATRIAQATVTPGTAGENQVTDKLIKYTDVYTPYNVDKVVQALAGVQTSAGMDLRISSVLGQGISGIYCMQAWDGELGPEERLVTAVVTRPNKVKLKGDLYCKMYAGLGDLWGGVPQGDLQNEQNIHVVAVEDIAQTNEKDKTIIHSYKADITITARFGILTQSQQIGNLTPKTLGHPDYMKMWAAQKLSEHTGGADVWIEAIDKADGYALDLAKMDTLAPYNEDGVTRSNKHMDDLLGKARKHFNEPSPNPNEPWPYDNLMKWAVQYAKENGFTGVSALRVNLVMPNLAEPTMYYYLENLDSAPKRVIDPENEKQYRLNVYALYKGTIDMGWAPKPPKQ